MAMWIGLSAALAWSQPELPREELPPEVLREQALEAPGEVVLRGAYAMRFGQRPVGRELFVISQSSEGWHVRAWIEPEGGAGDPFHMAINYNQDLEFRNAEWETYGEKPLYARYGIAEDRSSIIMYSRIGDKTAAPETYSVPEGEWYVSGPALVGDFGLLARHALRVGDSVSLTQMSFGAGESVRMTRSSFQITREKDPEGPEGVRRYTFVQSAGGSSIEGELIADELGAPLRATLRFNQGELVAVRDDAEGEEDE